MGATHQNPPNPPCRFERLLTVEEIEAALVALLAAIEENEDRERDKPARFRCTSAADLAKTDPAVWKVEDLAQDPVGRSCREQIKALGKLLYRVTGSTDAMLQTLERLADLRPERRGKRYDILDKWWSGIGNEHDVWYP